MLSQIPGGHFAVSQKAKNLSPGGVGQGFEDGVHEHNP
jgi:hypothetical protein